MSFSPWAAAEMSFSSALSEIQVRNTDLQVQTATMEKVRAQRLGAFAEFLPTLNATLSDQQYSRTEYFSRSGQALLTGKINLFRSGADMAALRASGAGLAREEFQLRQTSLNAVKDGVAGLVDFIQAARQVKVSENILHLNEELLQIVEQRYKRGLISQQDWQKTIIERANSSARLQDVRSRFEQAKARLNTLLGQDSVETQWPWQKFLTPENAERWLARKVDLNLIPSYRAAQMEVEAQDYLSRARFRQFLPSVDFTMDYGYQNSQLSRRPGWDAYLLLTIPLFDLKKHSDYRVQVEQKRIAQVREEQQRRSLTSQWQDVKARLSLAVRSAREREESVRLARSLYQANQQRMQAGRSSMNDVVVDQNRLADAEVLEIAGWADAHNLYVQMCQMLNATIDQTQFGCID